MVLRIRMSPAKRDAYFKKIMSNWTDASVTAFNGMLKAMSGDMVDIARFTAPRKTGHLASNIFEFRKESLWRVFTVGYKGDKEDDKGFYSHMVESGTNPHVIGIHKKDALKIGDRYAMSAQHPGAKAEPFFYPAYRVVRNERKKYQRKAIRALIKEVGHPI